VKRVISRSIKRKTRDKLLTKASHLTLIHVLSYVLLMHMLLYFQVAYSRYSSNSTWRLFVSWFYIPIGGSVPWTQPHYPLYLITHVVAAPSYFPCSHSCRYKTLGWEILKNGVVGNCFRKNLGKLLEIAQVGVSVKKCWHLVVGLLKVSGGVVFKKNIGDH